MKFTPLLVFALCAFPGAAFSQFLFHERFGNNSNYLGADVRNAHGTGYIITGDDLDNSNGLMTNVVIKTDYSGGISWKNTYADGTNTTLFASDVTNDGGYVFAGYQPDSANPMKYRTYVVKTDQAGIVSWSHLIDSPAGSIAAAIRQTSDSGFIITGTYFDSTGLSLLMMMKLNYQGTLQWANSYGSLNGAKDEGMDVVETNDGGYAALGFTGFYGAGSTDIYLVKADQNGNLLWTKTYGGTLAEYGYAICKVNGQDNFYLCGYSGSFNPGFLNDGYLLKVDANGGLIWSKRYSGAAGVYFYGMDVLPGNEIALCGAYTTPNENFLLVKTDSSGNVAWSKQYDDDNQDYVQKVRMIHNGEFIMAGGNSLDTGSICLIKTDNMGNSGCNESVFIPSVAVPATQVNTGGSAYPFGMEITPIENSFEFGLQETTICFDVGIDEQENKDQIDVYPSPFTSQLNFLFHSDQNGQAHVIELYDVFGKCVQRETFTGNSFVMKRGDLASGIYLYRINEDDQIEAEGKIIAE